MAMPAVQRSGSVRKARPPVRRPSFRDDTNLVAIRYEKTLQGEAPTPITTVNPIRTPSRPASSASGSTSPASPSPVVVLPPREPPEEQHPALRTGPILPPKEEWKRDSGHGTNSSSNTPTINEEDCEDESVEIKKLVSDLSAVQRHDAQLDAVVKNVAEHEPELVHSDKHDRNAGTAVTPNQLQRPMSPARFVFDTAHHGDADADAAASGSGPSSPRIRHMSAAAVSVSSTTRAHSRSAAKATSTSQNRLVKSFSLRSVSSLLSSNSNSTSSPRRNSSSAPMQPLMRGSPSPEPGPTGADSGPSSPGTPENPSKTRKSSGAVPSLWKRQLKSSPDSMSQQASRGIDDGDATYSPLTLSFPTDDLLDDDFIAGLSFSKRGSVMFGGQRALPLDDATMDNQQSQSRDQPRNSNDNGAKPAPSPTNNLSPSATPASESVPRSESAASNETPDTGYVTPDAVPQAQQPDPTQTQTQHQPHDPQLLSPPPDIRVMAADLDRDSQKVRSLYAANDTLRWEDGALPSLGEHRTASPIEEEVSAEEEGQDPYDFLFPCPILPRC